MAKQIKTYIVPVLSTVSADYHIKATSKLEAYEFVAKEMQESMERQIANAPTNPAIKNLFGDTLAYKSLVKIKKN